MALLDKNQIMEIIPHRDPFLLIDEVEELEIGKRVVAKKFIAPDSFWFLSLIHIWDAARASLPDCLEIKASP